SAGYPSSKWSPIAKVPPGSRVCPFVLRGLRTGGAGGGSGAGCVALVCAAQHGERSVTGAPPVRDGPSGRSGRREGRLCVLRIPHGASPVRRRRRASRG